MRYPLLALALLIHLGAHAADEAITVPPPPPVPTGAEEDLGVVPEITIIEKDDATVTEYRMAGKLYLVKVKPKHGPEYYLSDDDGTGQLIRRDGQTTLRPPRWIIKRF